MRRRAAWGAARCFDIRGGNARRNRQSHVTTRTSRPHFRPDIARGALRPRLVESHAHETARQELYAAIAAWDEARRIEAYFAQVLLATEGLEGRERDVLLERVSQARALVGGPNPLESLSRWKSPLERLRT